MQSALFKFAAELRLNVFFALKLTNLIVSFSKCFFRNIFLAFFKICCLSIYLCKYLKNVRTFRRLVCVNALDDHLLVRMRAIKLKVQSPHFLQ